MQKGNTSKGVQEVSAIITNHIKEIPENAGYEQRKSILIPILEDIQDQYGHVSKDSAVLICEELKLPLSHIYGVITFYNSLKLEQSSDYQICVCRGTACHVNGSDNLLDILKNAVQTCENPDLFTIETVNCVGACSLAPVFVVNEEIYGNMTKKKVQDLIKELLKNHNNKNG